MTSQIRGIVARKWGLLRRFPALALRYMCTLLLATGVAAGHASAQSTIVHEDETGDLTISVTDISTDGMDGIRVINNQEGDVTITSDGTINVDSTGAPAIGILVKNENVASSTYTTTVNVNHMFSNADASEVDEERVDIAALRIHTTGGANVRSTGHIHTTGMDNFGVHVQQDNNDNAGPIKIHVNDITTEGPGSYGVYADSVNPGNDQIGVTVDGTIRTSGWGSYGVAVSGNRSNVKVLVNELGQIIFTPPGEPWEDDYSANPGRYAVVVRKSHGGENSNIVSAQLTNHGLIRGDVDIASCMAPRFENRGTGTFNPYGNVTLELQTLNCSPVDQNHDQASWTTGRLINHGTFVIGLGNQPSTVRIQGDVHQKATGTLSFDVNWSTGDTDRIEVTGMANLDGMLAVNSLANPDGETAEVTIITATEGINGENKLTIKDTPFLDYSVRKMDGPDQDDTEVLLLSVVFDPGPGPDPDTDLDPESTERAGTSSLPTTGDRGTLDLNQNQRNVLTELRNSRTRNDRLDSALAGIYSLPDIEDVRFELDSYGNEIAGAAVQSTFLAALSLASQMPDCSRNSSGVVGRRCIWASGHADRTTRKRSWPQRGFRNTAHGLSSGIGIPSDDGRLMARFGLGLTNSRLAMDRFATARGHRLAAVAGITAGSGNFGFSLDTAAAASRYKVSRIVPNGDGEANSTGKFSGRSLGVQAEAAWTGRMGKALVSPSAGIFYSRVRSKPYREQGADEMSLNVHRSGTSLAAAKFGAEIRLDPLTFSNLRLAPGIGLGMTRMIKNSITVESEFQGGEDSFLSTTSLLPKTYDIGLGSSFRSTDDRFHGSVAARLKLERDGRLHHLGVAGRIVIPF